MENKATERPTDWSPSIDGYVCTSIDRSIDRLMYVCMYVRTDRHNTTQHERNDSGELNKEVETFTLEFGRGFNYDA